MKKAPKVSVLIPVYNVEKYLRRCLNSVLNQTLKDIEVVAVNDGSKDNSLAVLQEIAAEDKRLIVIDKENGGLPSARNAGIVHARGEYLMFLDSDDYIDLDACEYLYKLAKQRHSDVIIYGGKLEPESKETSFTLSSFRPKNNFFKEFNIDSFLNTPYFYPYLVRDFIKRDLLIKNNLLLDQTITVGEDIAFQFKLFPYAKNVCSIDKLFYHYDVSREGAITNNSGYSNIAKRTLSHIFLIQRIFESWENLDIFKPDYYHKFIDWEINFIYWNFVDLLPEYKKEVAIELIKLFKATKVYDHYYELSYYSKQMIDNVELWKDYQADNNKELELLIYLNEEEFRSSAAHINRIIDEIHANNKNVFINVYTSNYDYGLFFPIESREVEIPNFAFSRIGNAKLKKIYLERLVESRCKYLWALDAKALQFFSISMLDSLELKKGHLYLSNGYEGILKASPSMFVFDLSKIEEPTQNSKIVYFSFAYLLLGLLKKESFGKIQLQGYEYQKRNLVPDNSVGSIQNVLKDVLKLDEMYQTNKNMQLKELIMDVVNDECFCNVIKSNTFTINPEMDEEIINIFTVLVELNTKGYCSKETSMNKALASFIESRFEKYLLIQKAV